MLVIAAVLSPSLHIHTGNRSLSFAVSPGSAVFKSFFPACLSSFIYVILFETTDLDSDEEQIFDHPYPMGALISALTFLLAFRANFAYNRYWEAVSAIHQMHSKWLDVGMDMAAFHLQSARYDKVRPPAFGEHPDLTAALGRHRAREYETTLEELEEQLNNSPDLLSTSLRSRIQRVFRRRRQSKKKRHGSTAADQHTLSAAELAAQAVMAMPKVKKKKKYKSISRSSAQPVKSSTGFTSVFTSVFSARSKAPSPPPVDPANLIVRTDSNRHFDQAWEHGKPPLFLQEGAHLLSLLSAVAFSTLRNDLEQADSPLTTFIPGVPWPHVDPDAYGADVRKDWAHSTHRSLTVLKYLFGLSRSPADRTLYNAARPFRVVGGVSDQEVELLAAARGASAKVALAFMWLEEFVSREHLNGSTGKIAPPIISRLFQFLSDGMSGYNQARKVAYIPFPFPHAQITSLFVVVVVGMMPVLMLSYLTNETFGFVLNLLTVMVFTGLHEVARELESPFFNVPNDLPLNNFQAQFNEALMAMFAGYHPGKLPFTFRGGTLSCFTVNLHRFSHTCSI
jgi:predicted membrane chloride channel (bestrophin family)